MRLLRSRKFWLILLVSLGLAWRLGRYFLNFPIWGDEAAVGLNILDRSYLGLLRPLNYVVACPVGFLWISKWMMAQFGASTFTVRFVPLVAALASVLLMYPVARQFAGPWVALLATGLLACSLSPARFSNDFKPYSIDLLVALAYTGLGLWALRRPRAIAPLLTLILFTPLATVFSYPSVFVAAAVSLALAVRLWRIRSASSTVLYLLFSAMWLGCFGLLFFVATGGQLHATHQQGILRAWGIAFPPWNLGLPWWLIKVQFGNMMSYPMGGEWGIALLISPLCWLGVWRLWRSGRRAELVLLVAPFLATLAASSLRDYPYGRDARVEQHLVPSIMLLAPLGFWNLLVFLLRGSADRRRALQAAVGSVCAALVIFAVIAGTMNAYHPWISHRSAQMRTIMRDIFSHARAATQIVLLHDPNHYGASEIAWYLQGWPGAWRVGLPSDQSVLKTLRPDLWFLNLAYHPVPHLAQRIEQSLTGVGVSLRLLQRYHQVICTAGTNPPVYAQTLHFQSR